MVCSVFVYFARLPPSQGVCFCTSDSNLLLISRKLERCRTRNGWPACIERSVQAVNLVLWGSPKLNVQIEFSQSRFFAVAAVFVFLSHLFRLVPLLGATIFLHTHKYHI